MSHWITGSHEFSKGWRPIHQLEWIAQGHHLLPWFDHPDLHLPPQTEDHRVRFFEYYEDPVKQCRELKLPIGFVAAEWEHLLSAPPYLDLPADQNPNVVTTKGVVLKQVCPFGPIEPWREVGRKWTDNLRLKQLQEWYPNPPLVIFLSNNEHSKLTWTEAESSARYLQKYGAGRSDEFKREVIAQGWIERYRALQEGMRDGLVSAAWRKKARFVGYGAFGIEFYGRWGEWNSGSTLQVRGRLHPGPLMWDGGNTSYYTPHGYSGVTDFTVWSPQVEFMNDIFQQAEAYRLNENFWIEFSVWDGHDSMLPDKDDTRKYYTSLGQTFTPERYAGWAQFGMWLVRPRVVREYRGWTHPCDDTSVPYFFALVATVDRVYTNPTLRKWWRHGELVPNRDHPHPYQENTLSEYQSEDRWFMLDTNLDPKRPWSLSTPLPVFSLALTRGQSPKREWLVYAHAPLGDRQGVKLTIPDYQAITVDVPVAGRFFEVTETDGSVQPVTD
jgi:hypothetical protein